MLLESMNDYMPSPPHAPLPSAPGPAPSKFVPCEACRRAGRVKYKGRDRRCFSCDGTGLRRRRKGDPEWCAYVELPVAEAQQLLPSAPVRAAISPRSEEAYGWERAHAAYNRAGSYAELERALIKMVDVFPVGHAAIVRRYLWGVAEVPSALEERAVRWLAGEMQSVRVPRWVSRPDDISLRIRELGRAGMGAGAIGRKLGVKKAQVKRVLRRTTRSSGIRSPW